MRELFPKNNSTDILGKDSDIVKQEDLLPVVQQLQTTIQQLNILSDALQQYKDDNESLITTEQLNAVSVAIQSLEATESNLTSAEVDNLTVNSLAEFTNILGQIATISDSITAPNGIINDFQSQEITAGEINVDTLKARAADIDEWAITNFSIDNLSVSQKIETPDIEATTAKIATLEVDGATINNDASIGGDLNVTGDISGASIDTDEVGTENIHWTGLINLSNVEEFYLEVPHFENGSYFIQLLQNANPFATIEIYNSVDNYFVRWSQSDYNQITHIYKYETDQASKLYFKVENESGNALDVRYASTCATSNVEGPATYVELPIEEYQDYEIRYKDGSKFFKNVDMAQQGGTIGIFRTLSSDDYSAATDDVSYDTTEDITAIIYKPDQSVNTDDDVAFHEVDTTFLNVRDFSTRNFAATELQTLSTIDLTKYDDGAIIVVRIGSTSATPQPSAAYIKQTENGTPVLYKIMTGKNLPSTGSNTNKPLIWSVADQAITEATNIEITGTIDVGGNATFGGDVDITGDISADNATITGNISGDSLDVAGNTIIHGDLYVDGVTHTTTEEQVNTTSDTLTLRQNNNTTLGATYAGIIVNKYNGTEDLALVSNSDGTLRVGTGTGSTTSYANIYWDDNTSKWYSDSALTIEVTPTGTLTSWVSLEIIGDVKHYTGAIFTQINFTGLVPLLARDEAANLNDGAIMKWNGTDLIAETIPNPSANGQVLANGTNGYEWVPQSKNFVFATMADYTAAASTVPNGSLVIIENEDNYLIGENQ